MGIDTFVRKAIIKIAGDARSPNSPDDCSVAVVDLMQWIKTIPENVNTVSEFVTYIIRQALWLLAPKTHVRIVVLCVDRYPGPAVKQARTHVKRYSSVNLLSANDGPHLPSNDHGLLPEKWMDFAGNGKLLQRELYPLLLNAFLCHTFTKLLRPGQMVILHGFPCKSQYSAQLNCQVPTEWPRGTFITEEMEQEDPDLYNRIYLIEHVPPNPQWPQGLLRKAEWEEAKNDIAEADLAVFYYDHWFQGENQMIVINDGDALPIALLYAYERVIGNSFRNKQYVRLPNKSKKTTDRYDTFDINKLYQVINEDKQMRDSGVQNPIVTFVFMVILGETDFFRDYMKGIGKEKFVWRTLTEKLDFFSHLVQLSKGVVPNTRVPREIVMDEDRFELFVHYCFLNKHGKSIRKKRKRETITIADVKAHCKDFPTRNQIRSWARAILWNMQYWINGVKGTEFTPDPYEEYDGHPYYGYIRRNDGTTECAPVVTAHQKPVDEVYSQHFLKAPDKPLEFSTAKKRRVVEIVNE
jgi:hypothetical protein